MIHFLSDIASHETVQHVAENLNHAAHEVAAHGEHAAAAAHHSSEHASPHVANWVTLLGHSLGSPVGDWLIQYEKVIYSLIVVALITFFCVGVTRKRSIVPSKAQLILENLVLMLDGLVCGVIGPQGRKYTPFVGSLFIYIVVSNLFGLVPLQNSATAYITTTAPLAICVFFYVQWIGISKNGIGGYLYHLAGSPKDTFGYVLVPLNLPLHILGEFSKPISLMFRLYGNVMAGHILVAVFLGLGLQMFKAISIQFIGFPLHFPFLFLEILVALIQGFVFALLTTVYIAMMLPHEHEEHHEAHHSPSGAHHAA